MWVISVSVKNKQTVYNYGSFLLQKTGAVTSLGGLTREFGGCLSEIQLLKKAIFNPILQKGLVPRLPSMLTNSYPIQATSP